MEHQATNDPAARIHCPDPSALAQWVQRFDAAEMPILADSARLIEEFRAIEDNVDAHLIAQGIAEDPLMILKLLRHVAQLRRPAGREHTDAETATEALVMLGITPFFRSFGPQPAAEDQLTGNDRAMVGLKQVIARARRAARFALAFAIHRQDHDAAVIHEAALLHDFAEMLLWIHAPDHALQIQELQLADPALRSVDAQMQVLQAPLADIQQALMKAWKLPDLLVRIADDQASPQAQVRNVQLAIRIARHSAQDWQNPAIPDDIDELATLLNLGTTPTWTLVTEVDG